MFVLTETSLEKIDLKESLLCKDSGALSCFEGYVRTQNAGKTVVALQYEAHPALCQTEADKIILEAKDKFSLLSIKCYHRTGRLVVGEMAVWVGVTAQHRKDAFDGCRYVIDELKRRLPIWKKEYYEEDESQWVGCEACDH